MRYLKQRETAKGTPADKLPQSHAERKDNGSHPFKDFRDDKYLMAVTKDGTIKKTAISQFDTNRKTEAYKPSTSGGR